MKIYVLAILIVFNLGSFITVVDSIKGKKEKESIFAAIFFALSTIAVIFQIINIYKWT